ncbi:hypothetical protein BJV77DRAFT_647727 [Russula vinacea]|nr:hypothetical protein BJV77DRAFT_647727 [Russula vinacea]
MVGESITHGQRCRWYTCMVGRQSSLTALVKLLRTHPIINYAFTELVQGRWALAWSITDTCLPDVRPKLPLPVRSRPHLIRAPTLRRLLLPRTTRGCIRLWRAKYQDLTCRRTGHDARHAPLSPMLIYRLGRSEWRAAGKRRSSNDRCYSSRMYGWRSAWVTRARVRWCNWSWGGSGGMTRRRLKGFRAMLDGGATGSRG